MHKFCVECGEELDDEAEDILCDDCFHRQEFTEETIKELNFHDD